MCICTCLWIVFYIFFRSLFSFHVSTHRLKWGKIEITIKYYYFFFYCIRFIGNMLCSRSPYLLAGAI